MWGKGKGRKGDGGIVTLKLWTGRIIISDGKGKESPHVSENENKDMPEKVG